ncbi:RNA polymerase sigma factor [Paenibacillus sediminis]|uniref:RNA polymerase sigma factor (Sigma-70 family) n=1 Tax=Paenibacillus sediminis TaxID=664909 RepID=A0ABS4GZV7_9BACL|nr:RNA polymerase sigma factor (sigma-70 family) [Paenibacillus sediminis]
MGKEERVIDEQTLIEQIRRGETAAFRKLVESYGEHVYQAAYSILRDVKEAEDAAQETFIQVYKSLPEYRSEGLKMWITRIAIHKAIDTKRKIARRREEQFQEKSVIEQLSSHEEDVLMRLVREEKTESLLRRVAQLPASHREVITAFYLQDKTYDQIAREQGVAVKTVESKLYRARSWIRNHWKEEEWR